MISEKLLLCLPDVIREKTALYPRANEIRMRKNRPLCFTIDNKNLVTDCIVKETDIEYCVINLCKNSLHTYFEQIKQGYIPFDDGYRIGVCGDAVVEKSEIINISKINSLNIRIPTNDFVVPYDVLKNINADRGILIYSPANYGKTTLLKALTAYLSLPPNNKRISVIDCKKEIYSEKVHQKCSADFYSGYPKYQAIDMAIRTMSPEIIVCDEIGLEDDIASLIEAKNCGINLICTAHAKNTTELFERKNIARLHTNNVFYGYIGIFLESGKRIYKYQKREDLVL